MHTPIQKILYGPPGAGKSTRIRHIAAERHVAETHIIEAAFHPEYTYGDFVARIMPTTLLRQTDEGTESLIRYQLHVGPFVRAVALALRDDAEVLLVIDEINRGNSAAIFGDIFQLLDRDEAGASTYGITLSDLLFSALMKELGWLECDDGRWLKRGPEPLVTANPDEADPSVARLYKFLGTGPIGKGKLRIPGNLSILATMNTSDESVYVMDTAFKRRWSFEFLAWDYKEAGKEPTYQWNANVYLSDHRRLCSWHELLTHLNRFIAENAPGTRFEDKLIGLWFIKAPPPPLLRVLNWLGESAKTFEYAKPRRLTEALVRGRTLLKDPADQALYDVMRTNVEQFLKLCVPFQSGEKSYSHSRKWNELHDKLFPHPPMQLDIKTLHSFNNYTPDGAKWQYQDRPYPRDQSGFIQNRGPFLAAIIDLYAKHPKTPYIYDIPGQALDFKLLHFVWDNIFYRDKRKLENALKVPPQSLRTFDEFLRHRDAFLTAIVEESWRPAPAS